MINFIRQILFISVLVISNNVIYGQCAKELNTFKPGEIITYDAYYNWGFIWIHAGDVKFMVDSKTIQNKPVYQFTAIGISRKSYDWMYRVRDTFQTYVDKETFQPLWFQRNTNEGGYIAYESYTFNQSQKQIYSIIENSDKPLTKDTLILKNCTLDLLTAIYTCRSLNFDNIKQNQKIPITTVIDNKIYPLYIRYLGKETVITKKKEKFKCIKFSALMIEGTIFKGGEDMYIWVTDDNNRVPVLVEAKILIGSVKAYLNTTSGLIGDLKSKIQ